MVKHFVGWYPDGTTFGMDIEANTPAYRALKKNTIRREIADRYGFMHRRLVCPAKFVAGVMREASWIVAEDQSFGRIQIDGGEEIYIEYPDGIHI